ncbi:MAG: hypothetical protein KJ558_01225 [Gammaproteobacteria bacterium]|nr:hypothetical protein [Gammaproteobacteria bacterium]MBU1653457.1 hypothetical protein [Gammaproteobacteria bacterium]MBU1961925.1 hypothetical protein [Gammaproteobacteria bacterium]
MKLKTLLLTPLLLFFIVYSVGITASDANYGPVQPNESLWTISGQHQASQGSVLLKWMLAFYNANPNAFIKGNINLLRQGISLQTPSLQQVEAINKGTALKTLVLHNLLLRSGNPVIPGPAATSEEAQAIQQHNAELLDRIQAMTVEMEGLKSQAAEQQRQVTDLKNQISELQTQLSLTKTENADLKAQGGDQSAQSAAAAMRQELEARLNSRIRELEGLLAQSNTHAGELEANLKVALEARQVATSTQSEKEVQLEAQVVQLQAELAETQNQVKKLEGQLKAAQEKAEAALAETQNQVKTLEAQLKAAQEKAEAAPAPQPAQAAPATVEAKPAETAAAATGEEAKPLWQDPATLGIGALVLMLLSWLIGKKSGSGSGASTPQPVAAKGPLREPSKDDEILTKLDMARAYLEMGNGSAARAVLQEVISEGNDKAKKKARGMLAQLNKAA